MNPIHVSPSHLLKIHFNITLLSVPRSSKLFPFLRLLYVPRNLALQASVQDTIHIAYLRGPVTLTTHNCYISTRHRQTVLCNGNEHIDCEW
jgi:hypothetical protein